jgi:putative integral membrane protein (TIGR02587 family)
VGESAGCRNSNGIYARELARGVAGAVLFAFPLLMTMEMWWLGLYMDQLRLALFLLVGLFLVIGLSWHAGFSDTPDLSGVLADAFSAYGIGVVTSALLLALFGIVTVAMNAEEIVGKVAVQSVPAAIGAILARKQLAASGDDAPADDAEQPPSSYAGELFLMFGGAVFVAFNVAPTDEMALIAHIMTPWHAIALALLSILALHALVYAVELRGQEKWPEDASFLRVFLRFSLAGYGIALMVSGYILWTFGRTDDTGLGEIAIMVVVLGFPAALGAATARLVI